MLKPKSIFILSILSLASCRGVAGFWKDFMPSFVLDEYSDQGPWGGTRRIYWLAKIEGTFTEDAVKSFAQKSGWNCIEEKPPSVETENKPEHQDYISGDSTGLRCDNTGWMRIEPGTEKESPAYGFFRISIDGTKMVMVHRWGDQ